jgi:hypothetical protein
MLWRRFITHVQQKIFKACFDIIPTLKTAIEACDKLFGWSKQDAPTTLVQVGYIRELEQTPQPVVSCVSEVAQIEDNNHKTA